MNVTTARAPDAPRCGIPLTRSAGLTLALLLSMAAAAAAAPGWGDADRPSRQGAAPGKAVAKSATADPAGDTFGTGLPVDVTYFSARTTADELLIDLAFAGPIAAPSSGAANAVAGFIDLDVDGAAATGEVPFVDFLTVFSSGLASDFYVDLLSYTPDDGQVDLMQGTGDAAGRVPMSLSGSSLGVRIPLALLGGGDTVRTAAVVGTSAEATDAVPNGGSLESSKAGDEVLLNGDRFAVEIAWRDFAGNLGSGTLAVRSEDSAVFWFFTETNWELMVKVLDACGLNGHYWVYAAATTDVEYTLTVRDTSTGSVQQYFNPLGTAAAAVNDTAAFDCR